METLLLNKQTSQDIDRLLGNPPHALLIIGSQFSGKSTLAKHVASSLLDLPHSQLAEYPYCSIITPINGAISISEIRSLGKTLQLKTLGTKPIRRVVIVENGHTMTQEAQNALLKNLEEPPQDTVIIVTTVSSDKLLPTIVSRTRQLVVRNVLKSDAHEYYKNKFSDIDIEKAFMLSGGAVSLLSAVLERTEGHLIEQMDQAKSILSMSTFDRLAQVDQLIADKQGLQDLIFCLKQIALAGSRMGKNASRWHKVLSVIHKTEATLHTSVNPKLALTNLMISI